MTSSAAYSASSRLLSTSTLISQGAEAKVYKATLVPDTTPILLKHRFKKQYRHSALDVALTKARVAGEARALLKCLRSGVNVPGVRMVDASEGLLGIEWIEGIIVKRLLPSGSSDEEEDYLVEEPSLTLEHFQISVDTLMSLIGAELAKMHLADIIHGDLTTSNLMLRRSTFTDVPELVLIDFGLSYHSSLVEDKAVDLYVLERAFASTHPDSEPMFASVLTAYEKQMGKDWPAVRRRLDDEAESAAWLDRLVIKSVKYAQIPIVHIHRDLPDIYRLLGEQLFGIPRGPAQIWVRNDDGFINLQT